MNANTQAEMSAGGFPPSASPSPPFPPTPAPNPPSIGVASAAGVSQTTDPDGASMAQGGAPHPSVRSSAASEESETPEVSEVSEVSDVTDPPDTTAVRLDTAGDDLPAHPNPTTTTTPPEAKDTIFQRSPLVVTAIGYPADEEAAGRLWHLECHLYQEPGDPLPEMHTEVEADLMAQGGFGPVLERLFVQLAVASERRAATRLATPTTSAPALRTATTAHPGVTLSTPTGRAKRTARATAATVSPSSAPGVPTALPAADVPGGHVQDGPASQAPDRPARPTDDHHPTTKSLPPSAARLGLEQPSLFDL